MKVILSGKIHGLGNLGDIVDVKRGYGRNYLIPYGKAISANEKNIAEFELRRSELEKIAQESLEKAQKRAEQFTDMQLHIQCKAREGGKLFGSVGIKEIVNEFENQGVKVANKEVDLPDGTIREIGNYNCVLRFHSDVAISVGIFVEEEK